MQAINCTVELYCTALGNTVSHHFYFSVVSSDTDLVFFFKSACSDVCCKHSPGKDLAAHRKFLILRQFLWMEHLITFSSFSFSTTKFEHTQCHISI